MHYSCSVYVAVHRIPSARLSLITLSRPSAGEATPRSISPQSMTLSRQHTIGTANNVTLAKDYVHTDVNRTQSNLV